MQCEPWAAMILRDVEARRRKAMEVCLTIFRFVASIIVAFLSMCSSASQLAAAVYLNFLLSGDGITAGNGTI